jgi:uncharacterized protein YaiE (UPF0345 family)
MLSPEGYREWTEAFSEGSYYEGSWEKGKEISFLLTTGQGTVGVIAENKPYEFVSINHIGTINNGVIDTKSAEGQAWAQSVENNTFTEENGQTEVKVEFKSPLEYGQDFEDSWTMALTKLKMLCEVDSHKNYYSL